MLNYLSAFIPCVWLQQDSGSSLCPEGSLSSVRAPAAAHRHSSCGAGLVALQLMVSQFRDQGWNPHPLRFKLNSQPLDHEGSPSDIYSLLHLAIYHRKCPDMEVTGSKLGKDYDKAVYYHLVYLNYMQSTSREMLGWMNQKRESRSPGEISTTSYIQMIPV